jgi:thermitase
VSGDDSPALEAAIAAHPATLYVVAAGNDGTDEAAHPTYPCSSPAANVLCVGASDQDDRVLPASNTGSEAVDLFAPGSQILTDALGGREAYDDGSSMAAAFVSGAAALLLAADPGLTTSQLKLTLMDSTDRRDALAASVTGGRLDAAAALASVRAPTGQLLSASLTAIPVTASAAMTTTTRISRPRTATGLRRRRG